MKRLLFVALSASCPIIPSAFKVSPALNIVNSIPRGGDETSYSNLCEEVKSRIVENASKDVSLLLFINNNLILHLHLCVCRDNLVILVCNTSDVSIYICNNTPLTVHEYRYN